MVYALRSSMYRIASIHSTVKMMYYLSYKVLSWKEIQFFILFMYQIYVAYAVGGVCLCYIFVTGLSVYPLHDRACILSDALRLRSVTLCTIWIYIDKKARRKSQILKSQLVVFWRKLWYIFYFVLHVQCTPGIKVYVNVCIQSCT